MRGVCSGMAECSACRHSLVAYTLLGNHILITNAMFADGACIRVIGVIERMVVRTIVETAMHQTLVIN